MPRSVRMTLAISGLALASFAAGVSAVCLQTGVRPTLPTISWPSQNNQEQLPSAAWKAMMGIPEPRQPVLQCTSVTRNDKTETRCY